MSRGGKREGAGRRRNREQSDQQRFDQARGMTGRTHGLLFSYSLDEYEYDFLKAGVRLDGNEPTDARVRAKAKALTREALRVEMLRILQHPDLQQQLKATK